MTRKQLDDVVDGLIKGVQGRDAELTKEDAQTLLGLVFKRSAVKIMEAAVPATVVEVAPAVVPMIAVG